jgi:hypothetical protein
MLTKARTKRNLLIMLIVVAVVGLTMTAWAKKPDKPPGGGKGPIDTGTIYFNCGGSLWSMNPDGTDKTPLPVYGTASMTRHGSEPDRWFLQVNEVPGYFYPITVCPPDYWLQISGLDDLEVVGFTGDPNESDAWRIFYNIEIDGEGQPDTFKWRIQSSLFEESPAPWVTGVPITGDSQDLIYGSTCLTIKFEFTTGHAGNDQFGDAWCFFVHKTQRHEIFAVREDGQSEVQLTYDTSLQPWTPGNPDDALPSWAMHEGVVDGKISYLAQRWGKDDQNEDVVLERGLFAVEINWDESGQPDATTNPTILPVTLPLEIGVYELIPYDWSPDGTWIVYAADGIRVANAYEEPNEWLCDGWTPIWSPVLEDGSTLIAFRIGSWGEAQIRTISPGGGSETTILTLDKSNLMISGGLNWSPNGTHLIYTQIQSKGPFYNDAYDIYRVGADGSDSKNLTKSLQEYVFSMDWRD